jgi:glycosyltransferase involved in cell wall biosynthesis
MSTYQTIDCLIPCYNEETCIPSLLDELDLAIVKLRQEIKLPLKIGIVIVNDGSRDSTATTAANELQTHDCFTGKVIVNLSRNFGKEAALLAGLRCCDSDACIILDADLQDPPILMIEMVNLWLKGYKVVNAVRNDRTDDNPMKRLSAKGFYWLFDRSSHLRVQFNSSDFRLLDRAAINAILSCNESIRFSKGFFAWVGFDQANIYFKRPKRQGGETKWGGWKLWNYALDGIFSFSTAPLRVWSYLGIFVTLTAFSLGVVASIRTLFLGIDVPGYASLFTAVTFLGGLQLIGIGILGEYIGRIYIETKQRPQYVISGITRLE